MLSISTYLEHDITFWHLHSNVKATEALSTMKYLHRHRTNPRLANRPGSPIRHRSHKTHPKEIFSNCSSIQPCKHGLLVLSEVKTTQIHSKWSFPHPLLPPDTRQTDVHRQSDALPSCRSQHKLYFTCKFSAWGAEDGERAVLTALARSDMVDTMVCSVGPAC